MAGLKPTASAAPPPGAMDEQGEGEQPNVTPEEQAAYDRFVDNGMQVIYSPQTFPKILDRMKQAPEPVEGLAAVGVMVVTRLKQSAEKAGQQISPDVMYQGGVELLEDLAELAEKAGIHSFTEDEIEGALYRALDMFREANADSIDKGAVEQDWAALVQADQSGELDQAMPGLKEHFAGQGGEAAEEEEAPAGGGMRQRGRMM